MNSEIRKLDFLIVSTGRAASTAIYRYVSDLGGLSLPWNKEPHYWCSIDKYGGIYPELREITITKESEYWSLYSESKYAVDASVGYFFCLDDVVNNLRRSQQMPKVILLYREPVSRSRSFFYEKKKKNMTKFNCVEDDMKTPRQDGLWWEYYYDNVDYFDNYIALESYFTEILAINYHYFSRNQLEVMGEILKFINIDKKNFDGIKLEPVNSSKEAILTSKMRKFRIFRSYLPGPIEKVIGTATRKALRYCTKVESNDLAADIRPYLQNSLSQYEKFRDYIKHEDVVWLRKSL